jgi:hypothetical protein
MSGKKKTKRPARPIRGPAPGERGRPSVQIEPKEFEVLCKVHATLEEIAGYFMCSDDTIENFAVQNYGMIFSEIHKKLAGAGKVSLRRAQMQTALKGNPTMQIWCGKQLLGQRDKQDIELGGKPDGLPVQVQTIRWGKDEVKF